MATDQERRIWRDSVLKATDVYMVADFPIDAEQKTELVAYRQALRDMPDNQFQKPDAPTWLNVE